MSALNLLGTLGIPAAVAAIVTALISYRGGLQTIYRNYELEEQKKLRELMGRYTGRMLEAAVDWDRRMTQLYDYAKKRPRTAPLNNEDYDDNFYWHFMCPHWKERHEVNSPTALAKYRRDPDAYFYQSVVFRFLSFLSIARRFEAEAFYIDATLAKHSKKAHKRALYFLRYAKSFLWVMTFQELSPRDSFPGVDHFRDDEFRPLLDLCYKTSSEDSGSLSPDGKEPIFDWPRFRAVLQIEKDGKDGEFNIEVERLLSFFDELRAVDYTSQGEKRRRWERLICLHLLTLNFIATFGYAWQRDITDRRRRAIEFLSMDNTVIDAFLTGSEQWLGLDDQEHMISLKSQLKELRDASPATTMGAAVARLEELGATKIKRESSRTIMHDQGGNKFFVDQDRLKDITLTSPSDADQRRSSTAIARPTA